MQNAVVIDVADLRQMIAEAVRDGVQQALPSEPIQTAETLITENELRQVTGLSHPTVMRLRKQGKLPFLRVGKSIRFRLSEVTAAMESQASRRGGRAKCTIP